MKDWKIGDLALCIKSGKITRMGKIYTVAMINIKQPGEKLISATGPRIVTEPELLFKLHGINHKPKQWAHSNRFIKVTPEDEDEFDREIINNMKEKINENFS